MSKRIPITPAIEASIRHGIGDPGADVTGFAVFETRMVTDEPLNKSGFFKGAVVTPKTIAEMNAALQASGSAIPFQLMHDTSVTPQGKVFASQQGFTKTGATELRGMFFVPGDRTQLIADIENSVIDEVSIGIKPKQAICSQCDFDYLAPESDIMNMLSLTCDEGHTIGQNGVHVNLVGLDSWMELSGVGKGAARNAKIMPRAMQTMSKEAVDRLAASHIPGEACFLTASYEMGQKELSKPTEKGDLTMTNDEILAKLTATSTELGTLQAGLAQRDGTIKSQADEITALKASLKTADEKVATITAAQGDASKVVARAETAEADVKASIEKLKPHLEAALVADGDTTTKVPETLTAMVGLIEEKGLKLHQAIGTGARSKTGAQTEDQIKADAERSAKANFKL